MSAPHWSPVDDDTASLLTLVADTDHPSVGYEWDQYLAALDVAADHQFDGLINPNVLRPLLRGVVAPRRVGAFANRALKLGLVEYTGEYVISDDTEGRNGGKPCRVMRLLSSSSPRTGIRGEGAAHGSGKTSAEQDRPLPAG